MAIYVIDLDGTLCDTKLSEEGYWRYLEATPYPERIEKVNRLYDDGHTIIIETARGCVSGKDWYPDTIEQLTRFGLRFHDLRTGIKHAADFFIDDRAINADDFFGNGST
jgi:hypothetical protein